MSMHHVDISMEAEIYGANNKLAEHNAEHFREHAVFAEMLGVMLCKFVVGAVYFGFH